MSKPRAPSSHTATDAAPRIIRSDGWTIPRQRQFLKMLAVTGSVERACNAVNMSTASAYRLRLHPAGGAFREGWARALVAGVAALQQVAIERAISGIEEQVWYKGEVVGHRHVQNDRLLMFVLRHYGGKAITAAAGHRLVEGFDILRHCDDPSKEAIEPGPDDPEPQGEVSGEI